MDDEDNGILASVPGQYIAQAARCFPEPATSLRERVSAEIDADWAGVVRIHTPSSLVALLNFKWVAGHEG